MMGKPHSWFVQETQVQRRTVRWGDTLQLMDFSPVRQNRAQSSQELNGRTTFSRLRTSPTYLASPYGNPVLYLFQFGQQ